MNKILLVKKYFKLIIYFIQKIFLEKKFKNNSKNFFFIFSKLSKVDICNVYFYKIYNGLNWCNHHKNEYKVTFEEEIPFQIPNVFNKIIKKKKIINKKRYNFVTIINNAEVFGSSDIIISKKSIINEATGDTENGNLASLDYEKMVIDHTSKQAIINLNVFKKKRKIKAGIFLCGLTARAWGHWYPEYLGKIFSLKKSKKYKNFPLIVNSNLPQSHIDSLKYFLENKKIIYIQDDEIISCDNLIYSPCPSWFPSNVKNYHYYTLRKSHLSAWSPFALNYVKLTISNKYISSNENIKNKKFKKIFLSRESGSWNKLINEKEIINFLKKDEFYSIDPAKISFEDQVHIFKSAEFIVAPAGSALNNLIFCDKRVKVIILNNNNYFYWGSFCGPLQTLGYKNIIILAEPSTKIKNKFENYSIPIGHLSDCLYNFDIYLNKKKLYLIK